MGPENYIFQLNEEVFYYQKPFSARKNIGPINLKLVKNPYFCIIDSPLASFWTMLKDATKTSKNQIKSIGYEHLRNFCFLS